MTLSANPLPLTAYVITDGRAGIEAQALGLAEALAEHIKDAQPLNIIAYTIEHGAALKAASPALQFAMKSKVTDYGLSAEQSPHIAIGCGRQAIAPLLALKKAFPEVMTVYIQDPRMDTNKFDLVIAPEHDGISGGNVEVMIGAPNRVTDSKIIGETLMFSDGLSALPMPRAAMLIGGISKTHTYNEDDLSAHLDAAKTLLSGGMSLLITTSRRTPDFARKAFARLASDTDNIWLHDGAGQAGANPYFAFLGGADIILVTQDSTNMLTEGCSTGKPVFTLSMSPKAARGKSNASSGKFEHLYERLKTRCGVVPYAGQLAASQKTYDLFDETARIAARVWERYQARIK